MTKREQLMSEIITKYEEYVKLLNEEFDSIATMAYVHGWRSTKVEQGEKIRAEIASLNSQLSEAGEENRYLLALSDENVQKWIESEIPINNYDIMEEGVNKWCRKAVRLFAQSIREDSPAKAT